MLILRSLILIGTLLIVIISSLWLSEPMPELLIPIVADLVWICGGTALLCFIISERSDNYSQVDKIWSIMPIVYAWYAFYSLDFPVGMNWPVALITVWGIRLTFNFARRGAYSWKFWQGEEDYRWAILRERREFNNRIVWRLFNLFFISLYQNGLILFFTLPVVLCGSSDEGIQWPASILAILLLMVIMFETVADQQQWNFQQAKKKAEPGTERGFINSGLWRYCRHPNYLAEQIFWVGIYAFSVLTTGEVINWSIGGCLLLIILFKGSSDFSESISASRYPAYSDYQKNVGRFFPRLW